MKKVLVAGATGHLGRFVRRSLSGGATLFEPSPDLHTSSTT